LEFIADANAGISRRSLLAGKPAIDGKSTAYVCIGPVCSAPILDPLLLQSELREARHETVLVG
jgi:hypothetical protein